MKPVVCSDDVVKDFMEEFNDAFHTYNACVDDVVKRSNALDKNVFKIYDFISKVICGHRCVVGDDNSCDVVRASDYLELLNDFEYVYEKIKECL